MTPSEKKFARQIRVYEGQDDRKNTVRREFRISKGHWPECGVACKRKQTAAFRSLLLRQRFYIENIGVIE